MLAYELRQNTNASQLEAAEAHLTIAHELDIRLATDPELVPLILTEVENRDPAQRLRVGRWNFALLRSWENGYFLNSRSALEDELWQAQVNLIEDVFRAVPEVEQYWRNNRRHFSIGFNAFLDELVSEPEEE